MIAGQARSRILADHAVLRELLRRVANHAAAATREETLRPRVRNALAELRARFEQHLSFEESVLPPLLEKADAWADVRIADMAKEHAGQRALLVALTEDADDSGRSMTSLAEELVWFVDCIERDMREEEEKLLSATALGEETVVVDQTDG